MEPRQAERRRRSAQSREVWIKTHIITPAENKLRLWWQSSVMVKRTIARLGIFLITVTLGLGLRALLRANISDLLHQNINATIIQYIEIASVAVPFILWRAWKARGSTWARITIVVAAALSGVAISSWLHTYATVWITENFNAAVVGYVQTIVIGAPIIFFGWYFRNYDQQTTLQKSEQQIQQNDFFHALNNLSSTNFLKIDIGVERLMHMSVPRFDTTVRLALIRRIKKCPLSTAEIEAGTERLTYAQWILKWLIEHPSTESLLDLNGSDFACQDFIIPLQFNTLFHKTTRHCVISFHNANLKGANLQQTCLADANLQKANVSGAHLQGADMYRAQLQGANVSGAQLQGAHLCGADLRGANLCYAQLQGADLFGAQLQGANLSDAQLEGANLSNARMHAANLDNAQLQGAYLYNTQVQGVIFQQTNMHGVCSIPNGKKHPAFTELIHENINKNTDIDHVIFSGGLQKKEVQETVDTLTKYVNSSHADAWYTHMQEHIGTKEHTLSTLPSAAAKKIASEILQGKYTKKDAEAWITAYQMATKEH